MNLSEPCDFIIKDYFKSASLSEVESKKKEELQCSIVTVNVSKSVLNLMLSSTTRGSSTICRNDVIKFSTCAREETNTLKASTCSSSEHKSLKSCTCTTEDSSLKICTCSDSSDCDKSNITINFIQSDILEYTLAIIKPDAMIFCKEIEHAMLNDGFKICQRRWLQLTPEQVSDFFFDNCKKSQFAQLISYMSSEPILVFVLSKHNAIKELILLMGPKKVENARIYAPDSIRGKYGKLGNDLKNAVHGSANKKAAEREINFFFPDRIKDPLFNQDDTVEYLKKYVNGPVAKALIKCCEEKPSDPVTWLGNWLLENNSQRPKYLLRYKSNLYD